MLPDVVHGMLPKIFRLFAPLNYSFLDALLFLMIGMPKKVVLAKFVKDVPF